MLFSEPSMRWCRIKDDGDGFTMVKVPIEVCHSSRKPVRNVEHENTQPSVKNVNLKNNGNVTSDSEDISNIAELSSGVPLMHNKKIQMNNAKAGKYDKHRIPKQEEVLGVKNFTHKMKLKDTDISLLLDADDYNDGDCTNDASFVSDKVIDKCTKPPSYQHFQLKSSCQRAHKEPERAALLAMKTHEVSTSDVPNKQTQKINIQKCENKVKIKYIKSVSEQSMSEEVSDLGSTLTSVKIASSKKQHKEQWSGSLDGCTEFTTELGKSAQDVLAVSPFRTSVSVHNTHSFSVLNTRHSDDKVAKLLKSQSCTSKSRQHRTSAKKKLSYEYSETKRNMLPDESPSRCNVTDTSLAFKDERNKSLETVRNGRAEFHTTKLGCTSKHGPECIQKSEVTDSTLVSAKNSETPDRPQDLLRSVSIVFKITFSVQS
jgi:hypothetical protein